MTQADKASARRDDSADEPADSADAEEHSPLATSPLAQAGLGVVAAVFGAVALIDATELDMFGAKGIPGPGFFPISLAVGVIALGVLLVAVSVVRGVRHGFGFDGSAVDLRGQLVRVAYVWVGFAVGVALMPLVGFVPATILLLAYLVFLVERIRGPKAVAVIVAVPLVAYALFVFVLGVELPVSPFMEGL